MWKCTFRFSAEPKRCTRVTAPVAPLERVRPALWRSWREIQADPELRLQTPSWAQQHSQTELGVLATGLAAVEATMAAIGGRAAHYAVTRAGEVVARASIQSAPMDNGFENKVTA